MKNFRKWWEKQCKKNIGRMFESPREFAEKGYRAAVEKILLLNSVRVHTDVYEDIKKELEDGD